MDPEMLKEVEQALLTAGILEKANPDGLDNMLKLLEILKEMLISINPFNINFLKFRSEPINLIR